MVEYIGNVSKTVRAYCDRHQDQIVEVTYGSGYATDSGMAYDVLLRSGWCDGSDPLGACHILIGTTPADIIGQLRSVRICDCADCAIDL